MATDGDRSLNGGIPIPQWMKGRITDSRLDFDETTFSPPANDDSFLVIRYPQEVTKKLKSPTRKNSNTTTTPPPLSFNKKPTELDGPTLNHTDPCKQYILKPGYRPAVSVSKSNGTDDGFKGEGAACGSSVIRVAHQMVSGRYNSNSMEDDPIRPKGFDPSKRRGSKSLPASPQGSPNSRRRLTNKYFTGAFVDNENHGGSWILQSLLSKRNISQSIGYIAEESTKSELEKAVSDLHINEMKPEKKDMMTKKGFKPKPSEFREMNFWSPTSM